MKIGSVVGLGSRFSIGVVISALFLTAGQSAAQQVQQKLHKHVPSVVSNGQAKLVGAVPSTQKIRMAVILRLRNQNKLTRLLSELYDPSSPNYRHFLTVQEFTDQFAPTAQDYTNVIRWAKRHDFTVVKTYSNRLVLDLSGTAAQVDTALNVSMNIYKAPNSKRTFYSIDRNPTLDLSVPVKHIEGLNDFSIPRPMTKFSKSASPVADVTGSGPGGFYTGSDMRAAYYGGSLLTGAGQSVGVLEFGPYRKSDVYLTFADAGQSYSVPINNVLIDNAFPVDDGGNDSEAVLDIAQAIGMAPGLSQVRVYIGFSTGPADILNSMATEDICKQLSISWSWIPTDPTSNDPIFKQMKAQGQTVFAASGDNGAYDASVSPYFYPAEDPYVTAVGGTELTTNYGGGPWVSGTAWNGSGGGASPDEIAIPSWQQQAAANSNGGSIVYRNVPDVAMEAGEDNFYCDGGLCSGGAGGTSFSAARWAGYMALINQQAAENGTAGTAGGVGFLNPALYSIGQSSNYSADFHDITSGNNDSANQPIWFSAGPGYDLVTGWGSPNGQGLIDALAGPIIPGFSLKDSPGAVNVVEGASSTSTISIIDVDGFTGDVSLAVKSILPTTVTGITTSFSPPATTGTSVLTVTASSSATVGPALIEVTGTSGTQTASTYVSINVNAPATVSVSTAGNLGSVNIGSASSAQSQTLTFTSAGTVQNISVLTQGVAGLDYANAGGGTCAVGTSYAVGDTCTVNVTFAPRFPGARHGAIVLTDANGNRLASQFINGTGVGPEAAFAPGTQTPVGSGLRFPVGVAALGDGSLYVSDYAGGAVYFEKLSNGTYTQSKIGCTFSTPAGIAVDGSGALYVADPAVPAVYKVIISNGSCTKTIVDSHAAGPWAVAVDDSGNVYIGSLLTWINPSIDWYWYPAVLKDTLQPDGSYVESASIGLSYGSHSSQTGLQNGGWSVPTGLAVDANGDVYVADSGLHGVFKETPSGNTYIQTAVGAGWTAPDAVAIDGSGNVYVADSGNNPNGGGSAAAGVYMEAPTGNSYARTALGTGWLAPAGIAVGPEGNVYVADSVNGVYKNNLADPPVLPFANTVSNAISSDSPKTVTVFNTGNAALQFSLLGYPADFPEAPGVSTDCTASTTVAAGATCTLSVEFLPTAPLGTNTSLALSESVNLATNSLNITGTQQKIESTGTEVIPAGAVKLQSSNDPDALGAPVTLTATVQASSGDPAPTGTVTFYNGTAAIAGPLTVSSGAATYTTSSLAVGVYSISASYSGDSNYVASNSNTITQTIVAAPGVASFGNTSIGSQNVGSTSSVIPLSISFHAAETLGGISVLTDGVPNLDFVNAGGGTCVIGTAYAANATCTVNVTFSPRYSGTRYGAVVMTDSSGNVIGTGYLEGTGIAPQSEFLPGKLTPVATGFGYPQGIAVDGSGNLYVADATNAAVYKETLSNGVYTQTAVGSGFEEPYAIAVDGAGNIYVSDIGKDAVYKESPSSGGYIQTEIGSGFISPTSVAVDAQGNVYIADFGNGSTPGAVYLETLTNGGYSQSTIGTGFLSPQSVAVDGNGNVYVGDSVEGNGTATVYKLIPLNGSYTQTTIGTGWITPSGIAVDGNGNVFVADDAYDLGNGFVQEETLQPDGTYVQSQVMSSVSTPYAGDIAVDDAGNLYIADNLDGTVYRDDLTDPPTWSFATTAYGSTSSDSPKSITVQNSGNATLAFSSVSYPADFPEATGVTSDCASTTSLAAESSCTLTANFTPSSANNTKQPLSLSEAVSIATNSLNLSPATQNISVTGTESSPLATVVLTASQDITTVGNPVNLTVTVDGSSGMPTPTGSVTFSANGTTLVTASLVNGTATYSTSSLALGGYAITAAYSGDQIYSSVTSNSVYEQIISSSSFGTQAINSTSTKTFTATFNSHLTLGSIDVVTDGEPNLDFTNAGGGTCAIGNSYASGSTCTVQVAFKPLYSGTRSGAIILGDSHGNLIQEIYMQGTGIGPQVIFPLGTPSSTVLAAPNSPVGPEVVDVAGNAYYEYLPSGSKSYELVKATLSGGSYSSQIISTVSSSQSLIGVDGSGAIYLYATSSKGATSVVKDTPVAGTYLDSTAISGVSCANGCPGAVDSAGNLYILDIADGEVLKEANAATGYIQSIIYTETATSLGTYTLESISVDAYGNVYFSDLVSAPNSAGVNTDYTRDIELIPSGNSYSAKTVYSGLSSGALGLYPDQNGNMYEVQYIQGSEQIIRDLSDGNPVSQVETIPLPTGLRNLSFAWIDDSGNFYLQSGSEIIKVNLADPPDLNFDATAVGSTSNDSPQTFGLENFGNAPLQFPVPSTGTNPSISSNFTLGSQTTCPQVTTSGPSATLNVDDSCNYSVNFSPTTTGAISGSLVLTDNSMGTSGGTQTVSLSGQGNTGTSGNAVIAMYMTGPDGVPQVKWVSNATALQAALDYMEWLQVGSPFTFGLAEFEQGTCAEIGAGSISVGGDALGATITSGTFENTLPNGECPGYVYTWASWTYTWGVNQTQSVLKDPYTVTWDEPTVGPILVDVIANIARISVSQATQSGSGPNGMLTATATLINPPSDAMGYQWTITGGGGAIVFPNGQETMESSTPTITVEEPNPATNLLNSTSYTLKVGVNFADQFGSGVITYGPATGSLSTWAKDNGTCQKSRGECVKGDPINIGTGNVFKEVDDYETAGQNKLSFIRYYNSLPVPDTYATTLGKQWRSNYDRYLHFISSDVIAAERSDGQLIDFHKSGTTWVSDTDIDDTLTQSGTIWTLTNHGDTVETYTQLGSGEGLLQSITMRNGYARTMAYNSSNQLTSVTDSYGRQLTLTYSGGTVDTVTTPDGLVLTYGYNSVQSPNDQLASVSYSTSPTTDRQYLYQDAQVPYALTAIVDEDGNTYESWTYDSHGRGLSNQVGGVANKVTVSYAAAGLTSGYNDTNLTRTVTNALGVTDTYSFAILQGVPKVTEISRAATSTTSAAEETFNYDANGYLNSETDWDGHRTNYVNDSHGDPTTINEGVGSPVERTTTIAYDPTFVHLPDTITTPGLTTTFTYDSHGEVLTKKLTDTTTQSAPYSTNGDTRTWTYTWQNALLASVQSPRTDVAEKTLYTYDASGALAAITNPLNQQTKITSHTGGGLPLTIVDPNGVTTTLSYDARLRLLSSTTGSHVTSYGYDAAGNLTSITMPDGSGLTYTYDTAHRLTGVKDLFGQKISYTLDALGDPTATDILNASAAVTSEHSDTFDALGRMLKDIGAAGQTSSFSYDPMGNMVTATDQANDTTQRVFDVLNRLEKITDPAAGITTTSYDAHDRPLNVTSPNGGATAYVYDGFGDLIQESSPNTGATVYYYDSTGNLIKRVTATGAVTQYTYDALNRVLTMTFPADSTENVTYTYDQSGHGYGIGRLTSVADAAGTLSRTYDEFGNLLTSARTTGTVTLTTSYSYDAANRIASIQYPSGTLVSYTRDIMGRITAVSAKAPGGSSTPVVSSIAYEPFGPYTSLTYGNGVAETRGFDQDYRMTGITDTGSSVLQNLSYAYYPTNNVKTITDGVHSSDSQSFVYDSLQRLSSATGSYGTYGYTYDKDGNRLTQALGSTTTTYGYGTGSDLLQTMSVSGTVTQTIGYTADGRMASFSPGIASPGGQLITALNYNQDAQISAVDAGSTTLASYTYNSFGQRVLKAFPGGTGEIYQYGQNGMLLEETDQSGTPQADYIYLNGRPIATLNPATGTLYYLQDDRLGTPQVTTDSSQSVAWQAAYGPFGQASVSGSITQNLRFPGQYYDIETGWNHNGFRDYIPELGRYAEPDPLGRLGSGNDLYVYVRNNPVGLVDMLGLCPKKCFAKLKYRPVRALGIPVANHSFWYVGDTNGRNYIVDAGPSDEGCSPWHACGLLRDWPPFGPKGHYSEDNPGDKTAWTAPQSSQLCSQVSKLLAIAASWNGLHNNTWYTLGPSFYPNSNSFAHDLANQVNFKNVSAPPSAPGWWAPQPGRAR